MAPPGPSRRALAVALAEANRGVRPSVHAVTAARRVQRTTPPHQIWSHTKTPPVAPWVVSGFISRSSGTNTVARVELGFSARAHPKPFSSSTENPGKDEATVSSHVTSTATSDDDATGTHKIADECLLQSETDATKVNPRKNLYMMFTCGVCETRAAKGFSRQAYENGVVIVRCPGCQNQHLVADHEGWFGDKGTIEDFLKLRGEAVARGVADLPGGFDDEGTLEIGETDLALWMKQNGIADTGTPGVSDVKKE